MEYICKVLNHGVHCTELYNIFKQFNSICVLISKTLLHKYFANNLSLFTNSIFANNLSLFTYQSLQIIYLNLRIQSLQIIFFCLPIQSLDYLMSKLFSWWTCIAEI